jgi:23S rRNA (uracil1939-C5)-methyltransferase
MLKEGVNLIVNEVTVEKWVYGGDSLARVDGRVLLAPYLLPGETAIVETHEDGKQMLRGRDPQVITPSAERVQPPCPYFYRCGGCQYQHARYGFQVSQKAGILREQLKRVGRIEYSGEIESISGPDLGYRNRTQFHLDGTKIGYFVEGTHSLVPIDHCPISSPKINEALSAILGMMTDSRWPRFLRSIELFTNEREVLLNVLDSERPVARHFFEWCAERIPGLAKGALEYEAAGSTFRVGHNSFFQVNRFLVDTLAGVATRGVQGEVALDLYSGVGLFSLRLAGQFPAVTAVESGRGAIQDLKHNASGAGASVTAVQDNVETFLAALDRAPDFVLADPPRAGLGKRVVRELARLQPKQIRMVACDPATLARDAAALVAAGYRLADVTMIDLFPHTYHIESVVTLSR